MPCWALVSYTHLRAPCTQHLNTLLYTFITLFHDCNEMLQQHTASISSRLLIIAAGVAIQSVKLPSTHSFVACNSALQRQPDHSSHSAFSSYMVPHAFPISMHTHALKYLVVHSKLPPAVLLLSLNISFDFVFVRSLSYLLIRE